MTSEALAPYTIYPIDCFSLSKSFEKPVLYHIFKRSELKDDIPRRFECLSGLGPDELIALYDSMVYAMHVQPSLLPHLEHGRFSFIPSSDELQKVLSLYEGNVERPISERCRFDDDEPTESLPGFDYTPLSQRVLAPIYTRHPLTGVVTKHDYPHSNLPHISLHIHPVFAAFHAYDNAIFCQPEPSYGPLLRQISRSYVRVTMAKFIAMCPSQALQQSENSPSFVFPPLSSSSWFTESQLSRKRRREEVSKTSRAITEWLRCVPGNGLEELRADDLLGYAGEQVKAVDDALRDEAAWRSASAYCPRKRPRY